MPNYFDLCINVQEKAKQALTFLKIDLQLLP